MGRLLIGKRSLHNLSYMEFLSNMKGVRKLKLIVLMLAVFLITVLLKQHSLSIFDYNTVHQNKRIPESEQDGWSLYFSKNKQPPESKKKVFNNDHTNNSASLKDIQKTFRISWYHPDPEIQRSLSRYDPEKCSVRNCLIEQNSSLADIVVLRHSFLRFNPVIQKRKGQLWVLYSSESPHHTHYPPQEWANQIDLSASYMESSDFFVPLYGRVVPRKTRLHRNYTGILSNKTKDAVWVSSHCSTPARRENLVRTLSKYLNIDTFGSCGSKKCGKQFDDINKCQAIFVDNYKFYFSFENSICDNYTTEKLYFFFRDAPPIIPVVNGPRDVEKYLPKNTYINSFDFASPKLLAEKLNEIGNNETEYIRFLEEKEKYAMPAQSVDDLIELAIHNFQCDMCRYLYERDIGKISTKPKTWQNVFNPSKQCVLGT
ncbi:alpha-(1,3)-fucosyltransferase 7-like isoform X1 [Crassostrea virginica]